jgi:hypothetical protein
LRKSEKSLNKKPEKKRKWKKELIRLFKLKELGISREDLAKSSHLNLTFEHKSQERDQKIFKMTTNPRS